MVSIDVLESLREFDTALLANTLDYIDATPSHEFYMSGDIQSVTPELGPTVGVAVTCQIDTSTPGDDHFIDPYYEQIERIAAMPEPAVWVVETVGSRPDHECVTGDGMAKTLYAAGCLGVVTDGHCRDIAGSATVPFAVYCRGTIGHHCALRVKAVDTPVNVGGITVNPGDVIHADREGVIKLPPGSAEILVRRAPQMLALEHEVHVMWRRSDLNAREKKQGAIDIFAKYDFGRAAKRAP